MHDNEVVHDPAGRRRAPGPRKEGGGGGAGGGAAMGPYTIRAGRTRQRDREKRKEERR